jgi:hypothetical protein
MSGVKNLVQAENKGLAQVTNEDLRKEGLKGADERETRTARA